jgi:hypothetical protein
MNQHVKDTSHFIIEEARKFLARSVIWGFVAAVVFLITPLWEKINLLWRSTEDIAAIINDIHDLQNTLRELSADVARATGEDRVIRQMPGLSYVKEPVRIGDEVILYITVQKTRLGSVCRMTDALPLFTDETGVTTPGKNLPPQQHIGTEPTKLRLVLTPPNNLKPGRVDVYMAFEYDCSGKITIEKTDRVAFALLDNK